MTNASFNKVRRKGRVCYNPRSAYVEAHGSDAASAHEPWGRVKTAPEVPVRKAEADRLTSEGSKVSALSDQYIHILRRDIDQVLVSIYLFLIDSNRL